MDDSSKADSMQRKIKSVEVVLRKGKAPAVREKPSSPPTSDAIVTFYGKVTITSVPPDVETLKKPEADTFHKMPQPVRTRKRVWIDTKGNVVDPTKQSKTAPASEP